VRVLDGAGASMATLRQIPGGAGFLLAYEKAQGQAGHIVRVCYYPTRTALIAGAAATCFDPPRRFSALNNGTPSFLSIAWRGSPANSTIVLGFHYQTGSSADPAPDREAVGTLVGFRRWLARRDAETDVALTRAGFGGSHGALRQFAYAGRQWRVYEADAADSSAAGWHAVLRAAAGGPVYPLTFATAAGSFAASFGNPVVATLPGPGGHGRVLAGTLFVFSSGPAADAAGELLFYEPL
jgi:hypothetical protein